MIATKHLLFLIVESIPKPSNLQNTHSESKKTFPQDFPASKRHDKVVKKLQKAPLKIHLQMKTLN